ncbi:MAG: haloacid dehalogenase [Treponema sp. CETP13]|nr:MAG: haloacid dehalogenase [Treponema sp. CETP13]
MMKEIKAVAFDIDGTLYPDYKLNFLVIPHFLAHIYFFICYDIVRHQLRKHAQLQDLLVFQSQLLAKKLHTTPKRAYEKTNEIIYKGLRPYFKIIKPFKYVTETFDAFKEAGLKLGVLSDFPTEQKGDIWGLAQKCDVVIGTEEIGALKPSRYTFGVFAEKLGCKPQEVLYVGNSKKNDIKGAKAAGMKTAFVMSPWRRLIHKKLSIADISFSSYRQLQKIVLD